MTFSKSIFFSAALAGTLILGSLSSCGVPLEGEEEMEKESVTAAIVTVIVTLDPCIGCAEARIAAAAARERAMAQAAAEAEARARSARDAQIARVNRCASKRTQEVNACIDTFNRASQGMAADKAACDNRAAVGCSTGNTAKQIATCIGNGHNVSEEIRRSCINQIPANASAQAKAQAGGKCNADEALANVFVGQACNGANNFNGFGSASKLCTAGGIRNCTANLAGEVARQTGFRVTCVSDSENRFLACLAP